jgi:hypothetical protein
VIKKPLGQGGHSPRWAAEPEMMMMMMIIIIIIFSIITETNGEKFTIRI